MFFWLKFYYQKARQKTLLELERFALEKPPMEYLASCSCCGTTLRQLIPFKNNNRLCVKCEFNERKNQQVIELICAFLNGKIKYNPQSRKYKIDGEWKDEIDLMLIDEVKYTSASDKLGYKQMKFQYLRTVYNMLSNNKIVIQEKEKKVTLTIEEFINSAKYAGVEETYGRLNTRNFTKHFIDYGVE